MEILFFDNKLQHFLYNLCKKRDLITFPLSLIRSINILNYNFKRRWKTEVALCTQGKYKNKRSYKF